MTIRFGSLSYRSTEGNGIRPLKLFCRFLSFRRKHKARSPECRAAGPIGFWGMKIRRVRREFHFREIEQLEFLRARFSAEEFATSRGTNSRPLIRPSASLFFPPGVRNTEHRGDESLDDFTCNSLDNSHKSLFDGYVEQ